MFATLILTTSTNTEIFYIELLKVFPDSLVHSLSLHDEKHLFLVIAKYKVVR